MSKSKNLLRKLYKEKRLHLNEEEVLEKSKIITKNLIHKLLPEIKLNHKKIALYQSFNNEVQTIYLKKFCEEKNFEISFPKINHNNTLDFIITDSSTTMKNNEIYKKIFEPTSNKTTLPNIIIVPLLCFDKKLNRLGYGKGFYDKTISKIDKNLQVITVGLAYDFQLAKQDLPTDPHDQKLNFIVTETKVFY